MTEHPTDSDTETRRRPRPEDLIDVSRMRRSTTDKKVAGVAGGLARYLDVDPTLLRVAFVVLSFFGGAGLLLYVAGWLLLPTDDGREAPVRLDDRSRSIALIAVAVIAALAVAGDSWGGFGFLWPVTLTGLVVVGYLLWRDRRSGRPGPPTAPPVPYTGWTPPAPDAPAAHPSAAAPSVPFSSSAPPTGDDPTSVLPTAAPPLPPPAPIRKDPRRTGPILFGFTLALIALAEGVLGVVDLSGTHVVPSAYPALALGVVALMLLIGSFVGRAGGLILLGLLLIIPTAAVTVGEHTDTRELVLAPTTAAQVQNAYDVRVGQIRLDLSRVTDLQNLDGRTIDLDAKVGEIDVILPRGVTVEATATIGGPGHIRLFGAESGGIGTTLTQQQWAGADAPRFTLSLHSGVGDIDVRTTQKALR